MRQVREPYLSEVCMASPLSCSVLWLLPAYREYFFVRECAIFEDTHLIHFISAIEEFRESI